ncbi:MAG: hypothetical protein RIM83_15480 [Allomuricauda sp.]
MANMHVLGEIKRFLDQKSSGILEITFAHLEILTYHNQKLLNRTLRQNSRIRIYEHRSMALAQMEVMDHLVFHFSLWFPTPAHTSHYQSKSLFLPRPLSHGILEMDAETLQLEFTIDTPNKNARVNVKHRYTCALP